MVTYELRGNRVHPMQEVEIASIALNFCNEFALNKRMRKKCERVFQQIEERSNFIINLSVKSDEEWKKSTENLTRGHFDPSTFTVTIPEKTYRLACRGDKTALFIIFHEFGHLFLGHRAVLHNAKKPPTKNEDAEWQADTFADIVLERLGFYYSAQLEFDFDGM
ncbi:Uncharacterised protein [Actinobacillus porcinus]|uniref:IrrE N-terminal-like domain-containing protein n=1 Tax=Actinobacillus porcinus TaxID=51048 RepID=A0ABY6TLP0_9PAST|nr:ImmA/IrrE family metallo-endopeptidase [Actinobacillus porcinus]VFY93610.1 Uncharacterised protein [Actinobacillus porcinus]VTU08830.1 Uncharacterised protein [Actinobacillus porcinus]